MRETTSPSKDFMESLQEYFERNDAEREYQRWRRGAFGTLSPIEEVDALDMIMGRGLDLPRPQIRFYDAGVDGTDPVPDFINSRFYSPPIFFAKNKPFVGFWCYIDNPYYAVESHYFDLMVVYKYEQLEIPLPFQHDVDINKSSFAWTYSGRPWNGWITSDWDVFAFVDGKFVADGSFTVL